VTGKYPQMIVAAVAAVGLVQAVDDFAEIWLREFQARHPVRQAVAAVKPTAATRAPAAAPEVAAAPVPEPATPAAAPAASAIVAELPAGDIGRGERVIAKCKMCHSFGKHDGHRVGPNLYGMVGAPIGAAPGYTYSAPMGALEGTWSAAALDAFLLKPAEFVPGTKMPFAGMADPQERADLIAFLASLADPRPVEDAVAAAPAETPAPEPAPVAEPEAATAAATAPEPEPEPEPQPEPEHRTAAAPPADLATRLHDADPERGRAVAKACAVCHGLSPADGHRIGPNLSGIVNRDIGGAEGFDYSITLRSLEGAWLIEWLDQYLADPQTFAPGTRMEFAGVTDAALRADLLSYLHSISPAAPPLPVGVLRPIDGAGP